MITLATFALLGLCIPGYSQTSTRKKSQSSAATPRPKPKSSTGSATKKATPKPEAKAGSVEEKAKSEKRKAVMESGTRKMEASAPPAKVDDEPADTDFRAGTASNVSIAPEAILEFQAQPAGIKRLIESCLELAQRNLTYKFGSADPANGGMDCSGFIYYVLRQHGLTQVPRDSSGLYVWVRNKRAFRPVVSRKADSFELDELLPGDLLFWIGTYGTANDPPVSHVMIYLGTEKDTGQKIMIGSSDGRTYHGQKRNGVSVFDFNMPRTPTNGDSRSTFIGYSRIPGLRD